MTLTESYKILAENVDTDMNNNSTNCKNCSAPYSIQPTKGVYNYGT